MSYDIFTGGQPNLQQKFVPDAPPTLIPYTAPQQEMPAQQQGPSRGQNAWAKFLEASSGKEVGKDSTYGKLMKLGNIQQPDFMGSLSGYGAGGEVQDLQPAKAQPFMPQQEQGSRAKIYALLQKYYGDPALGSTTNVGIPN